MNLFIYGTLLVPKVLEAVTGLDDLESLPATLPGYENRRVKGGDFPGIVKVSGRRQTRNGPERGLGVPGRVLLRVPSEALSRLDAYEDAFYVRKTIEASTADGVVEADAYVVPGDRADEVLSDEIWTLEWFEREALDRYWHRLFGP
ncbi:MAG: gamma-glutamylcyclotransferase family protein [Verrucomicrobiales bacterium]